MYLCKVDPIQVGYCSLSSVSTFVTSSTFSSSIFDNCLPSPTFEVVCEYCLDNLEDCLATFSLDIVRLRGIPFGTKSAFSGRVIFKIRYNS